jgi:hypothetical protein
MQRALKPLVRLLARLRGRRPARPTPPARRWYRVGDSDVFQRRIDADDYEDRRDEWRARRWVNPR